jgi:hypothetical protein
MNRVKVAVALADDMLDRLDEIARACQAVGFELDTELRGVGVLTGFVDADDLPRLRLVPGVTAVEPEREIHIGPPPRRSM